jgi:AraC-like DNA-binding protein
MDTLLATTDTTRRVALLEEFLLSLPFRRDLRIERALQRLDQGGGDGQRARVAIVAGELGLSERQLERLFLERVGVSPKHYARLRRFEHAAQLTRDGRASGEIAFATGYTDQAHFIREFRRFTGTTPRRLIRASDFVA